MDPHRGQTIEVSLATPEDRPEIYAIRHQVYARELGQHPVNAVGVLQDPLDDINSYVVAKRAGSIVGFVAVTPPTSSPGIPSTSISTGRMCLSPLMPGSTGYACSPSHTRSVTARWGGC